VSAAPEALSLEQKLADAFKGNAAGHLMRRSDILKSWYVQALGIVHRLYCMSLNVFTGTADS
jgi:hypothetical protein